MTQQQHTSAETLPAPVDIQVRAHYGHLVAALGLEDQLDGLTSAAWGVIAWAAGAHTHGGRGLVDLVTLVRGTSPLVPVLAIDDVVDAIDGTDPAVWIRSDEGLRPLQQLADTVEDALDAAWRHPLAVRARAAEGRAEREDPVIVTLRELLDQASAAGPRPLPIRGQGLDGPWIGVDWGNVGHCRAHVMQWARKVRHQGETWPDTLGVLQWSGDRVECVDCAGGYAEPLGVA